MDINDYVGKTLIAWHYFNERYGVEDTYYGGGSNKRCYVYPRLLRESNGSIKTIDSSNFPTVGRIEVKLQGSLTAEEMFQQCGQLVEIILNDCPEENTIANNWFSMKYNPVFRKDGSQIWIERFTGKNLVQVINVSGDFATITKLKQIDLPSMNIFTNEILIECHGIYYGPFNCDPKDNVLTLSGRKEYQYHAAEYSPADLSDSIFWIADHNDENKVKLVNMNNIPSPDVSEKKIDWIDDDKIINGFTLALKAKNIYTKNQIRQIKDSIIDTMRENCDFEITPARKGRIEQMLGTVVQRDDYLIQIAYYVLENKELSNKLIQLICTEHFDIIEKNSQKFSEVKEHLEQLQTEADDLEKYIEMLRQDKTVITEEAKSQQKDSIRQIEIEITQLIQKRDELKEIVDIGSGIRELIKQKDRFVRDTENARNEYEAQIVTQARLKEQLNKTISEFSDDAKIIARGLNSKLLERVLRAAGGDEVEETIVPKFDVALLHSEMSDKDIVARVVDYVREKANRYVTDNDIVNYLICITQGFITTFAGEPGTGKTSLCNILAKSLGLARTDEYKRFVDVSVERGWTSHKDFIGYYNPLTKLMEKSNADVFDALSLLDSEFRLENIAPYFILLDEANLSPIEHYWAVFLRNCDFDSTQNRAISLGGKQVWKIPEHLRFLATVNFDHTTEELSPRFLDRSWIITLAPTMVNEETLSNVVIENHSSIVSFGSLCEAFCAKDKDHFDDDVIANKWSKIQSIFKANNLQVMPRNLKMVRNYCSVACRYMDRQSLETRYAPLDYAVSQKILPTINGTSDRYKKLVNELLVECNSLPLCSGHLTRIKKIAEENMGFYQFFAK